MDKVNQAKPTSLLEKRWNKLSLENSLQRNRYALGLASLSEQLISKSFLQMENSKNRQIHTLAH